MKPISLILCLLLSFVAGGAVGEYRERSKPKPTPEPVEPTVHHHLYYLDRSECKKPV